jgi:hypothetical protein
MSALAAPNRRTLEGDHGGSGRSAGRVLVVFESGRSGAAALRAGAELAEAGRELSVVTLAPQAKPLRCCGGGGAGPYNCAVRAQASEELNEARDLLGAELKPAMLTVLVGHPDPPLVAWIGEHAFDIIVLPSRRLTLRGGRLARGLRRTTEADIRLVR